MDRLADRGLSNEARLGVTTDNAGLLRPEVQQEIGIAIAVDVPQMPLGVGLGCAARAEVHAQRVHAGRTSAER